jgi:hypothetical protein
MSIRHTFDSKHRMSSRRFIAIEKPPEVDTAELRRQIRLSKDAGHSKMPLHHTTLEKLLDAFEMLNGKPEDWRRTFGE